MNLKQLRIIQRQLQYEIEKEQEKIKEKEKELQKINDQISNLNNQIGKGWRIDYALKRKD